MTRSPERAGYVPVGDLQMYYEIHGSGKPLVLLHGGPATINISFGLFIPTFAASRQVIAVEQQGHGHTVDVDRPMSFTQMADDTAAVLRHLGVAHADVFGYSDGGNVALGLTIRHPELVRKLIIAGTNANNEGLVPGMVESFSTIGPDDLDILKAGYLEVAPRPEDWPVLVRKAMQMSIDFPGWRSEDLQAIMAHTLIVIGDEDIVRPEHAVEMFHLIRHSRLAVLPGADHIAYMVQPDLLLSIIQAFLASPLPTLDQDKEISA